MSQYTQKKQLIDLKLEELKSVISQLVGTQDLAELNIIDGELDDAIFRLKLSCHFVNCEECKAPGLKEDYSYDSDCDAYFCKSCNPELADKLEIQACREARADFLRKEAA